MVFDKKEYDKIYYHNNKEMLTKYSKKYYDKYMDKQINRDKKKSIDKKRKCRIKTIAYNIISQGDNCCICCGNKNTFYLQLDHKIPIAGKNREDTRYILKNIAYNIISPYNLQLLCGSCNSAKLDNSKCPIDHSKD